MEDFRAESRTILGDDEWGIWHPLSANREDAPIPGFGKFCVKSKGNLRGRHPPTGGDLMLAERRVVTFKCSKVLKARGTPLHFYI